MPGPDARRRAPSPMPVTGTVLPAGKYITEMKMADTTVSANRLELLQIADAVARDKSIDKKVVLQAMEDAIQRAARSRYGQENEIRAEIDPKSGEVRLNRLLMVVDKVENDATQISLTEARHKNPAANLGDFIAEPLPPV